MIWLSGWENRLQLTISGGCIDEDLYEFPVLVKIDSSYCELFNTIGSNSKKIQFTNSNGTRLYTEIQHWDNSGEIAILWTKLDVITSGGDTDFYLFYDNSQSDNDTYVGNTGTSAAQQVWDSYFICVYHFQETDGNLIDSTSNNHDGTISNLTTVDRSILGPIGNAVSFTNSYISLPDVASFRPNLVTIEAFCKTYAHNLDDTRIFDRSHGSNYGYSLAIDSYGKGQFEIVVTGTVDYQTKTTEILEGNSQWNNIAGTYDNNGLVQIYNNGLLNQRIFGVAGNILHEPTQTPMIGNGTFNDNYLGEIVEFRLSNRDRSASWIKATNYSNKNQLLTYHIDKGKTIEDTYSYSISGYVKQNGADVSRIVRLYHENSGLLDREIQSNVSDGKFFFDIIRNRFDNYFIVVLDEDSDYYNFNALIQNKIIPTATIK